MHQLGAGEVLEVVSLGGWPLQPVKCFPRRDHWWDQQPQGIERQVIVQPLVSKDLQLFQVQQNVRVVQDLSEFCCIPWTQTQNLKA